jgi:membrane protein involved in colicin uptake
MKKFILIVTLFICGLSFAQVDAVATKGYVLNKGLNEKPSIFPKGTEVLRKMISDNFRMRKINSHKNIFCEITFIVERDGTISTIKAKGNDEDFNKEAIRAVSKIKDKWIPAEINDQKVRSRCKIPLNINFN